MRKAKADSQTRAIQALVKLQSESAAIARDSERKWWHQEIKKILNDILADDILVETFENILDKRPLKEPE